MKKRSLVKAAAFLIVMLAIFSMYSSACSKSQPGGATTSSGTETTSADQQGGGDQTQQSDQTSGDQAKEDGGIYFIAIGDRHACAIKQSGELWCWGENTGSQLGDGTTTNALAPVQEKTVSQDWIDVALAETATCGIKKDNSLWCWGVNSSGVLGQLGNGDLTAVISTPTQVGSDKDWAMISARHSVVCVIKSSGTLYCWGDNWYGQLGIGDTGIHQSQKFLPTQEATQSSDWKKIYVGSDKSTCAIKKDNSLWCWGKNTSGQLGDGTKIERHVPTRLGTDTDWAKAGVSDFHACAIKHDGSLWCWGDNTNGQFGDGTKNSSLVPKMIGTEKDWIDLAVSRLSCGLKSDGSVWCWGSFLHDGMIEGLNTPTLLSGDHNWTLVAAGAAMFACGITDQSEAFCWGENGKLGLGDGTAGDPKVPTPVSF